MLLFYRGLHYRPLRRCSRHPEPLFNWRTWGSYNLSYSWSVLTSRLEREPNSLKTMRLYLLLSILSFALHVLSLPVPDGSGADVQDLMYRQETDEGTYDLEERSAEPSVDGYQPALYRKDETISGDPELQPRAVGAILEGVQMLVEGIMAIFNHIQAKVQHDKNVSQSSPPSSIS